MSVEKTPLPERVASYFEELSSVAADLNAVSDELGKSISEIDAALKRLNLGITTWLPVSDWEDPSGTEYARRDIGYARIGGKWGISLRKVEGDNYHPDEDRVEEWAFNDAPRAVRLEAIGKIPDLLGKLSKEAVETTKKLKARLNEAKAVAEAVKSAANRPRTTSPATAQFVIRALAGSAIDVGRAREDVIAALLSAGHASAAECLKSATWTLDSSSVSIEVFGFGKKMIGLTFNAAAERIIRERLGSLGLPTRFAILPQALTQSGQEAK